MGRKSKHKAKKPHINHNNSKGKRMDTSRTIQEPRYTISSRDSTPTVSVIKDRNATNTTRPREPRVFVTIPVKQKIDYLIQKCHQEVGWFCLVEHVDGDFVLTDIFVPKQTVHATETDIDSEAMAELAISLVERNIDTSKLYAWCHSHVNMAVSPSGQDETQIEEFLETCPIFIRGIFNKRNQQKIDVYFRDHGICYQCVPYMLLIPELDKTETDQLDALVEANVKTRSYSTQFQSAHGGAGYSRGKYQTNQNLPNKSGYWTGMEQDEEDAEGYCRNLMREHQKRFQSSPSSTRNQTPSTQKLPGPGGPSSSLDDSDPELEELFRKTDMVLNNFELLESTGFGISWDTTTPITERPASWSLDPDYLIDGVEEDLLAATQLQR